MPGWVLNTKHGVLKKLTVDLRIRRITGLEYGVLKNIIKLSNQQINKSFVILSLSKDSISLTWDFEKVHAFIKIEI